MATDSVAGMTLELPGLEGKPWVYVAGTRLGKRYVSYYLMSVYAQPDLVGAMSSELRRRMQGKSCFNFATIDEPLFAELESLTERVSPATPRSLRPSSLRTRGADRPASAAHHSGILLVVTPQVGASVTTYECDSC